MFYVKLQRNSLFLGDIFVRYFFFFRFIFIRKLNRNLFLLFLFNLFRFLLWNLCFLLVYDFWFGRLFLWLLIGRGTLCLWLNFFLLNARGLTGWWILLSFYRRFIFKLETCKFFEIFNWALHCMNFFFVALKIAITQL